MDTTQFVGAERLSQVLQSIKQAGGSGMPPLNTLVDGVTVTVDANNQLSTSNLWTTKISNTDDVKFYIYEGTMFIYDSLFYSSALFFEAIIGLPPTEEFPQPFDVSNLSATTSYQASELIDWVNNIHGGLYGFNGVLMFMHNIPADLYMLMCMLDLTAFEEYLNTQS